MSSPVPPASRRAPVTANVIVVHPQAEVRAKWAEALPMSNVWQVADAPAAFTLAQEQDAQLLIAPWPWAAVLVKRRRRMPACPMLLVGGTLDQVIVNAVAAGAQVVHLENEAELIDKVAELIQKDKSRAERHRFDDLRVEFGPNRTAAHLSDLSIDGFSFGLPAGANIEACLSGSRLSDVKLWRDAQLVLAIDSVTVRYLSGDAKGYRVGCSFDAPEPPKHETPGEPIRDPLQVAGALHAALAQKLFRLQRPDRSMLLDCGGTVDIAAGRVTLSAASPVRLEPLDVVQGSFEVGGVLYELTSVAVSTNPLEIRLPAELRRRQRRNNTRQALTVPLSANIQGVLSMQYNLGIVKDLSATGCSLELPRDALYPRGTQLLEVRLDFANGPARFGGVITRATRTAHSVRVGIEFKTLSEEDRLLLTQWLVSQRWPTLENGAQSSFDELFDLFVRSGLIKPAHIEALESGMHKVRETFGSLRRVSGSFFRSIVIHEKDKVVGHVSSVRAYQNTWYVQHLAAASGSPESALHVNLGVADFFDQLKELEYFKMIFYSENNWTGRAFGAFAHRIEAPNLSSTRKYMPLLIRVERTADPEKLPKGVRCYEVFEKDLQALQYIFVQQQTSLALRANDLIASSFELKDLNAQFEKFGLTRRRRAWVVETDEGVVAMATGEFTSPGLSLFDYLNSIRMYYVSTLPTMPKDQLVRLFMSTLIPHYAQLGVPMVRLLIHPSEMVDFEKLGFAPARIITEWTCHRRANRQLSEHIDGMGEALRERMKVLSAAVASGRRAPDPARGVDTISAVNIPIPTFSSTD